MAPCSLSRFFVRSIPFKRNNLAERLTVEAKTLADLKIEKASIDGERRMVEADLGPVRYLATLLGAGDQEVLRYFILAVALLLDPGGRLAFARCNGEGATMRHHRRCIAGTLVAVDGAGSLVTRWW
jgi:hypothetical protein